MTLRKISQIHKIVMGLEKSPSNLRFANAYIDQALMNFNYETMKKPQQAKAWLLIKDMIAKFNSLRGR